MREASGWREDRGCIALLTRRRRPPPLAARPAGRLAARALRLLGRLAGLAPADLLRVGPLVRARLHGGSEHSDNADLPLVASEYCLDPLVAPQCVLADPVEPLNSFRKWDATLEQARAASTPSLHRLPRLRVDLGPLRPHQRLLLAQRRERQGRRRLRDDGRLLPWFTRAASLDGGSDGLATFNHPGAKSLSDDDPGLQLERLRLRARRPTRAWSASRSSTTRRDYGDRGTRARARQGLAPGRDRRRGPRPPPHRRLGRAELGQDRDPGRGPLRGRAEGRDARPPLLRDPPARHQPRPSRVDGAPDGLAAHPHRGQAARRRARRSTTRPRRSSSSRAAAGSSRAASGRLSADPPASPSERYYFVRALDAAGQPDRLLEPGLGRARAAAPAAATASGSPATCTCTPASRTTPTAARTTTTPGRTSSTRSA